MKNPWPKAAKPYIILAPMAGYTESPFRRLIREIEPSTILVSELISAEALRRRNEKTLKMAEFVPEEKGYYGVQLFGSEASAFIDAAQIVAEMGADYIDLNLGCPSPKVVGSGHGSALLRDPKATAEMVVQLVQSSSLPVTVKMRLGFYDDADLIETARSFEDAGISALAIHGRTTRQKFIGSAEWTRIYEVKKHLKIPVIGNGDITSAKIGLNRLQDLDGIMIGRASWKNPWIFRQVRELFDGREMSPRPQLRDQIAFYQRHADLATDFKTEKWAMIEMRKHFAQSMRGFVGAAQYRDRLIRVSTRDELEDIFGEMLEKVCD